MNQVTYRLNPYFFPLIDQLPARWANSALPEQVAEDAKETSPNSPPIAAPPFPLTVLLRAALPCLIRPRASLRPAITVARLATVCGFAVGWALRSFFVVAEANRTKRCATSNSRSSALNP